MLIVLSAFLIGPLMFWEAFPGRGVQHTRAYATSEKYDQELFHVPVIKEISSTPLAKVEWFDLNVAMIPGFHVVMALLYRVSNERLVIVQAANCLASVGLIVVYFAVLLRYVRPTTAAALVLPLVVSSYFLGSAVWLVTDNLALFFATCCLAVLVRLRRDTQFLAAGVLATAAVVSRHSYIWLLLPLLAAGLNVVLDRSDAAPAARRSEPGWQRGIALLCASLALPLIPVAVFAWQWNGFVPRAFRSLYASHVTPAAVPFALALAGLLGLPILLFSQGRVGRVAPTGVIEHGSVIAALAMALCVRTEYSVEQGRWGGALWEVVRVAPATHGSSVAIVVLAPLGGLVLAKLAARVAASDGRWHAIVAMTGVGGLLIVTVASAVAFQRFMEPPLLVLLGVLAALAGEDQPSPRRWLFLVPLLVWQTLVFAVTTVRPVLFN